MSSIHCLQGEPPTFCKVCASLNYTKNGEQLKPAKEVKMPFHLANVPTHLIKQIMEKMNNTSFVRMRYSNKAYSAYIDNNRHHLKIALFHLRHIEVFQRYSNGPQITFDYAHPYRIAHTRVAYVNYSECEARRLKTYDFGEFNDAVRITNPRSAGPGSIGSDGKRQTKFTKMSAKITIYLQEWRNNAAFRRELYGVFDNTHVDLQCYDKMQKEFIDLIEMFFVSNRLTKIQMNFHNKLAEYATFFEQINLESLNICWFRDVNSSFLNLDGYKNLNHLRVSVSLFELTAEHCKNLETLVVHYNEPTALPVYRLLEMWIAGKLKLNEFCVGSEWDISLQDLNMKPIHKNQTWKYCRRYMSLNKWRTAKKLRVYEVHQKGTRKKAVFILTDGVARLRIIPQTI